jgi:hypothetical protein
MRLDIMPEKRRRPLFALLEVAVTYPLRRQGPPSLTFSSPAIDNDPHCGWLTGSVGFLPLTFDSVLKSCQEVAWG